MVTPEAPENDVKKAHAAIATTASPPGNQPSRALNRRDQTLRCTAGGEHDAGKRKQGNRRQVGRGCQAVEFDHQYGGIQVALLGIQQAAGTEYGKQRQSEQRQCDEDDDRQ